MTDRFTRDTAVVAIGQASVKLAQVVIAVVLVRLLAPGEWTLVAFALSIHLVLATVGALNVHQSIAFFLPRVDPTERRSLVMRCWSSVFGFGLLLAALTASAAAVGVVHGGRTWLVVVTVLAAAFEMPTPCVGITLISLGRITAAAWWDLFGTGLLIVTAVTPALAGWGARGVVGGLLAAGVIEFGAGLIVLRTVLPAGRRVAAGTVGRLVRYGLPLGVTVGVAMVNRAVDKWYIAGFAPADLGVYAVAAQEVPLIAVLPYAGGAALMTAFIDAFRSGDVELARTHWLHLTTKMSLVVVPLGLGLVLVAPEMLGAVFTSEYARAVPSFRIFTLVTIHRVAEYGMLLRAAGRTRAVLAIAAVTLSANLVLAGIGAAWWGMVGASLGTAIATVLGWWAALRSIGRTFGVPVRHAFAWSAWIATVGIASLAMVAGDAIARWVLPDSAGTGWVLVAKLGAFATVLIAGLRTWRRSPLSAGPAARYVPARPIDGALLHTGGAPSATPDATTAAGTS